MSLAENARIVADLTIGGCKIVSPGPGAALHYYNENEGWRCDGWTKYTAAEAEAKLAELQAAGDSAAQG